jgi:glutamyl/glutaminyl-tRNA synthetase
MNTRFNPTCNGRLHLGHLYLILVNQHMAKSTGGKFVFRFDDDQPYWRDRLGDDAVQGFKEYMREDMEWLGIEPDAWTSECAARDANEAAVGVHLLPYEVTPPMDEKGSENLYAHYKNGGVYFPYVPYLTAVKVVQDAREGIDTLVRGEDLVTEYTLYCHYCRVLGIPRPAFYYLPRMKRVTRQYGAVTGEAELDGISKTKGGFKISDLRSKGWTPERLVDMLADASLNSPNKGWAFDNVKLNPALEAAL